MNYPQFRNETLGKLRSIIASDDAPEDMKAEARAAMAERTTLLDYPVKREHIPAICHLCGKPYSRKVGCACVKVVKPPALKKPRKQQGREETQVHRDVRAMIRSAWPGEHVIIEEEMLYQLCEGHTYTVDFKLKYGGEDIRIEAKGPRTFEDSRVKFLWCMSQLRWAFFVWAKQHKKKNWTFEVWHAGNRLKMKGKRQNPRTMAEVAALIESESNKGEDECS